MKPSNVNWIFQDPTNEVTTDSELLDETSMTYRHYVQVIISLTLVANIQVTCRYSVNGQIDSLTYSLQGLP